MNHEVQSWVERMALARTSRDHGPCGRGALTGLLPANHSTSSPPRGLPPWSADWSATKPNSDGPTGTSPVVAREQVRWIVGSCSVSVPRGQAPWSRNGAHPNHLVENTFDVCRWRRATYCLVHVEQIAGTHAPTTCCRDAQSRDKRATGFPLTVFIARHSPTTVLHRGYSPRRSRYRQPPRSLFYYY